MKTTTINVATAAELQDVLTKWMGDGFTVTTQTEGMATLKKTAAENIFSHILVIGGLLLLCIFPGLIAIMAFAAQGDQLVVIRVDAEAAARDAMAWAGASGPVQPVAAGGLQWSDDRAYWWDPDKSTWMDATQNVPSAAPRSDDGYYWWDGEGWRPLIPTATNRTHGGTEDM